MKFTELNPDVLFNAINTYCLHMNCRGLESQVDTFLNGKYGGNIKFYEDGNLILHKIAR
jgi:hypothetical protein